jgi:UTP-glucose-1-phosphate uridylyltransferase
VYSILQAKEFLQKPFYFHCCDTIFDKEEPFQVLSRNTLIVTPTTDSRMYATITTQGPTVQQIHTKGANEFEYAYTGVSFLHDAPLFWTELEKIYAANPVDQSLSDIHAIQSLLAKEIVFEYQVTQHVYDTGNKPRYEELCAKFPSSYDILAKPNESLCFLGQSVIKFNADTKVNTKRYKRGLLLSPLVPRIYEARDNFIKMS